MESLSRPYFSPRADYHLEKPPLQTGQLQALYWGTPLVFAEADLTDGLQNGDSVRMSFSGIGVLENPVTPLASTGQLAERESATGSL